MKWLGLALLLFSPLVQEPPRITLEKTAPLRDLLNAITPAGGKIKVTQKTGEEEVKVSIKNARFFEALDAICRAQGSVTYARPDRSGELESGSDIRLADSPWVDYPSAYADNFKISVQCMQRIRNHNLEGETDVTRLGLILFAPPGIGIGWSAGGKADWTITDAVDTADKSVLKEKKAHREELIGLDIQAPHGNVREESVVLAPFDLDQGLKLLKGTIHLVTRETLEIKVPTKAGTEVATPDGKLVVDRVNEHEKMPGGRGGSIWHITVTYKTAVKNPNMNDLFDSRVGYPVKNALEWTYLDIPQQGTALVVSTMWTDAAPDYVLFRVAKGTKAFDLPFEFKNVVFKKN